MKVIVKPFTTFKKLLNADRIELDLKEGDVQWSALVDELQAKYNLYFLADDGGLPSYVKILVNDNTVEALDTLIKDGDEITLFSPIAGG